MTTATEKTEIPPAPPLAAYHWVITLQGYAAEDGVTSMTIDGTANWPPGYSRKDAYQVIVGEAQRLIREFPGNPFSGDPACILFFSLERDELPS